MPAERQVFCAKNVIFCQKKHILLLMKNGKIKNLVQAPIYIMVLFVFAFCFLAAKKLPQKDILQCFALSQKEIKLNNAVAPTLCQKFDYEFVFNKKRYTFHSEDFRDCVTENDKKYLRCDLLYFVEKFFPSRLDAVRYCFPEVAEIIQRLQADINIEKKSGEVFARKNTCTLEFKDGRDGRYLNLFDFSNKFYDAAKKFKTKTNNSNEIFLKKTFDNAVKNNERKEVRRKISFNLKVSSEPHEQIKSLFVERGQFCTNFSNSGFERKNNIKVAMAAFDGVALNAGECLSFNKTTGSRVKERGYMEAKIISGGTFTNGYGGGVCQVSTTLYNACLLAGLEILKVSNHSLPVSYVEPSFDAMVNSGSSDLVICNNTSGKIIITASNKNDICKFKIFGEKNKYCIKRRYEKTKIIPHESDEIRTDYENFSNLNLEVGESQRISYAKDGFCSNGYLDYFDENGNLTMSEKIRSNTYGATKGVIVKREK